MLWQLIDQILNFMVSFLLDNYTKSKMNITLTRFLAITVFCVSFVSLVAQNAAQRFENQLDQIRADQAEYDNQKLWCYLKFADVPTAAQRALLVESHVALMQYEPDLTWFANFPTSTSSSTLIAAGVVKLKVKPLHQKIDGRILSHTVPHYAKIAGGVKANITVGTVKNYTSILAQFAELNISVESTFEPLGILTVSGNDSALKQAAKLPFVIYIELPEPPAELEIENEMTMTRGPYINGYYNLDGLNGEGVSIAVNEGGTVDSIYSPDFKNRLDRSLESGTASGHKTGVSWRMASAGNINPIHRGQAWGADLSSGGINFTNAAIANVNIVNNSFGYGCITTNTTYNSAAATNDFLVHNYERFMITYSCGNIGNSGCATYGAGPGWGNITGLVKSAKNIFAVGAMNTSDQLTAFSSRGPAMDGRILPDITATGPGGTSHASPNLAGVNALLIEAYRNANSNMWPNSGLIKGIILNTADDIENPGPDYKTGFGRINARRALTVIDNNQFLTDSVANTAINTHNITVPTGVSKLKVTVYWTDKEATAGITGKTLVNNLDARIQSPSGTWTMPWVLNPFPHPDSLNAFAVRATDTLNNVELITLENPSAGSYTVEVNGALVPFGPQKYQVIYSFVYDSITVIYPRGGEGLVPGESRHIRWDAFSTSQTFDLDYSADSGTTWQSIATGLDSAARSYNWSIPTTYSGKHLVRVTRGSMSATSHDPFTVADPPTNLALVWRCADSAIFSWDSVPGALGYRVYRLANKFMDTVMFTTDTYALLQNLSSTEREWVTVQTVLPDNGSSRRAIAIGIEPGNTNCIGNDLAIDRILSPSAGYYPSCFVGDAMDLVIQVINTGTSSLNYIPIAFTINGGTPNHDTIFTPLNSAAQNSISYPLAFTLQNGLNTLRVWSTYPGDANATNDTLEITLNTYLSNSITLPYTQNFDAFNTCSTAWGCASIACGLSQGWYNLLNTTVDSIDWRTHSGATGSGGTGPSTDHTSGNGNYLYLEGSGNGGSGCQNKEALLHSPCIDLSGTNDPKLGFWYHAWGNSIGELHVDVLSDGVWYLDVAPPIAGDQGNQWLQQETLLNNFVGQEIVIRFRGSTGNGWSSDMGLDDINLTTLPAAQFTTQYDSFCLGQTVDLQNLTTHGNAYNWNIVQNTFTYASGSSTTFSPSILPNDTGWYDVQLIATNGTGSDTSFIQNAFYVGIFSAPSLTSNAVQNKFCFGDSAIFTATGNAQQFSFYVNGAVVQSGLDTTWSSANLSTGDSVWVSHIINPTCEEVSSKIVVQIQPELSGMLLSSSNQDLIICAGDTVTIQAPSNLLVYDFYIDSTLVQSTPDSVFQTNQLAQGSEVYCVLFDSIGCTGISDTLTYTVVQFPQPPSIVTLGNNVLQSTGIGTSYRWWKDGILLTDTTQTITATGNGIYEVQVIDGPCLSLVSEPYNHIMSGVSYISMAGLQIFPNPAREEVYLDVETNAFNRVQFYNALGQEVLQGSLQSGRNTIHIQRLKGGIYTLHLTGANGSSAFSKLIIQ